MARVVFDLLKEKHKTITAAESLTAGLFQSSIADFSGSSAVFNGGFVTYSIEEKSKMLHIPLKDLQEHGVVSHFTAEKMAEQSRLLTDADFGIGLTGVAGPDSLEGHPAGTVFIGIATREKVSFYSCCYRWAKPFRRPLYCYFICFQLSTSSFITRLKFGIMELVSRTNRKGKIWLKRQRKQKLSLKNLVMSVKRHLMMP